MDVQTAQRYEMTWIKNSVKKVFDVDQRLKSVEEQFTEFSYSTLQAVQSMLKKNWITDVHTEAMYGIRIALCVDTKDPLAQGRVRFWLPGHHNRDMTLSQLPWAWPVSTLGGFDDSGALWVPPAGSHLVLLFEHGDKDSAFYIGTTWTRDRGKSGNHIWGYPIQEYNELHQGHRGGYLVGPDDESQVLPPNNTDNYNIKDLDDTQSFFKNTQVLKDVVPSHQYCVKSPQKGRLRFHDGNYYCHHRWKRTELASSCGHTFLMYDDHMHPAAQYANPLCCNKDKDEHVDCHKDRPFFPLINQQFDPVEGKKNKLDCDEGRKNECSNKFQKHKQECRPFTGPGTPQNNTCELRQSGVFLQSISGHTFFMDDEVSEPQGIPNWERSTKPFDFGCEDKFYGKMGFITATGHRFHAGDAEDDTNIRSGDFIHPETERFEPNGFLMQTATGHLFEMNDHTLKGGSAGQNRRIRLRSTSNHVFEMVDFTNKQANLTRKEGEATKNDAREAYVRLRTGYGMQILMRDDNSQDSSAAEKQFLEITTPMAGNDRDANILRMQDAPPGNPGLVFLRAGGVMYQHSTDDWLVQVGSDERPASRYELVTENDSKAVRKMYFRASDVEYHFAEKYIILAAGRDCPPSDIGNPQNDPCLFPVVVAKPGDKRKGDSHNGFFVCPYTNFQHFGFDQLSNRVFASAGPPNADAPSQSPPIPDKVNEEAL